MCNITKCCQEVCPEHIHITDNSIIPLKERVADVYFDPMRWAARKADRRAEPVRKRVSTDQEIRETVDERRRAPRISRPRKRREIEKHRTGSGRSSHRGRRGSIVGAAVFHDRVRDGNGWVHSALGHQCGGCRLKTG